MLGVFAALANPGRWGTRSVRPNQGGGRRMEVKGEIWLQPALQSGLRTITFYEL